MVLGIDKCKAILTKHVSVCIAVTFPQFIIRVKKKFTDA